jgi:deoxyadenosine/deoxycytidine kinase
MFKQLTDFQREFYPVRGRIVCILGLPGVGKTTLGRLMAQELNNRGVKAKYFSENINKNFLSAYLKNPCVLAASFQYTTAVNRLQSYKEALIYTQKGGIAIMDGMLYSDPPFEIYNYERGIINDELHDIYSELINEAQTLNPPDFVIFLTASYDTLIKRLGIRGNELEIASYRENFYPKLYSINRRVLSSVELNIIDYNTEYTQDELKDVSINILREVLFNGRTVTGLPV